MKIRIMKILLSIMILVMSIGSVAIAKNANNIEDNNDFMEDEYHVDGTPNLTRWSYTSSTSEGLIINSGTATVSSSVVGYSNLTTKIEIYFYLQQYSGGSWKNIKTYKDTINSWYAAKEHSYPVSKGYKYRLRCSYYVYSGSSYDHFMEYTSEQYY